MVTCAKISANLAGAVCNAGPVGILPEIIILNFEDIEGVTEADNVVSAITLASGQFGYKWEGMKDSYEGNATLAAGTYANRFNHQVVVRVFDKTEAIKAQVNKAANGKFVIIAKNVSKKTADVRYEVFGLESGLELTDMQSNSTDTDGVFYALTFASSDRANESSLPKSFFVTDEAATKTAIEALLHA